MSTFCEEWKRNAAQVYRNPFEMPIRPLCRPFVHFFVVSDRPVSGGCNMHDTNRLCHFTFESSTRATWRFDNHRLVRLPCPRV